MTEQDIEQRALELFPPKYIAETWRRQDPDRNAPLRAAYVKGCKDTLQNIQEYEQDQP